MQSALRLASKSVPRRAVRCYATPASSDFSISKTSNGIKIATSDDASPTAAVSVIIKAGSRFENSPGLAHVLKNSVFKGTNKRSAIRLVRETEMYGGVLSSSLTRENLILTAEFMRGDEGFFIEALGDAITQAKFAPHEYNEEVIPSVAAEYEQAIRNPTTYAIDLAHQLAFRSGLGSSLFASPHVAVDYNSATNYAQSAFGTGENITVVASGVESSSLSSLVSEFFVVKGASPAKADTKTKYFGGEIRVPAPAHSGSTSDHFLLAFEGTSLASVELTVLRHLLGGESSVKWSKGSSPLSLLSTSNYVSAHAFNLSYSDAGLFGFLLKAPTSEMSKLAAAVVGELKKIAKSVEEADVKKAIAKAKFAAAAEFESRVGKLEMVGGQISSTGSVQTLEQIFAQLDSVSAASVSKAAEAALKSKPTTVAIGDTHHLPYADSIM